MLYRLFWKYKSPGQRLIIWMAERASLPLSRVLAHLINEAEIPDLWECAKRGEEPCLRY
jgi:hypothetical protein